MIDWQTVSILLHRYALPAVLKVTESISSSENTNKLLGDTFSISKYNMTKLSVYFPNLDDPESKIFQQFLFSTLETFRSQILTDEKQTCFIKQFA